MTPRRHLKQQLDELRGDLAEATGEGKPATVVLLDPSLEFPSGQRQRMTPTGRVVEIVATGASIEDGIGLTAPLPVNAGKMLCGVNPTDLV